MASSSGSTTSPDESSSEVDGKSFRLLSWNIDGRDDRNVIERTRAVCRFIKDKLPHAVFLQEVINETWDEIVNMLSETYDCYSSDSKNKGYYYVAILVHKSTVVTTGGIDCQAFSSSTMKRQLLQLQVRFAGANILLMTAHLESGWELAISEKRVDQLGKAFKDMKEACAKDPSLSCLFGGDLNLRDKEVRSVESPPGMVDVWEACGSPSEHKYTWDMNINDNPSWEYQESKPRCRFDRLYLMPEKGVGLRVPPADVEGERFILVGKERVGNCGGRFPSDHWGMWAEFQVQ